MLFVCKIPEIAANNSTSSTSSFLLIGQKLGLFTTSMTITLAGSLIWSYLRVFFSQQAGHRSAKRKAQAGHRSASRTYEFALFRGSFHWISISYPQNSTTSTASFLFAGLMVVFALILVYFSNKSLATAVAALMPITFIPGPPHPPVLAPPPPPPILRARPLFWKS